MYLFTLPFFFLAISLLSFRVSRTYSIASRFCINVAHRSTHIPYSYPLLLLCCYQVGQLIVMVWGNVCLLISCVSVFSCSPHAAHMHPPPQPGQMPPPGPPGGLPGQNDPTEPLDMQRMNSMYLAAKDGRMDRLEADSRGYHSVYAA